MYFSPDTVRSCCLGVLTWKEDEPYLDIICFLDILGVGFKQKCHPLKRESVWPNLPSTIFSGAKVFVLEWFGMIFLGVNMCQLCHQQGPRFVSQGKSPSWSPYTTGGIWDSWPHPRAWANDLLVPSDKSISQYPPQKIAGDWQVHWTNKSQHMDFLVISTPMNTYGISVKLEPLCKTVSKTNMLDRN